MVLPSCYLSNTAATICAFSNSQSREPRRQWGILASWREPLWRRVRPWVDEVWAVRNNYACAIFVNLFYVVTRPMKSLIKLREVQVTMTPAIGVAVPS